MNTEQEKQKITSMVEAGKLSEKQAASLLDSLDRQNKRTERFHQAAQTRKNNHKKQLRMWLLFAVAFFAFGTLTSHHIFSTNTGTNINTTVSKQSNQRPIDLSKLTSERSLTMKVSTSLSALLFALIVVVLTGGFIFFQYNGLVKARETVNASWAQVENAYQRRLDLVPLLIDTVKGYMEHERQTLESLTQARAEAMASARSVQGTAPDNIDQLRGLEAAQGKVSSALTRLLAVVENYPDLKANQNFLTLQDQMEGTENRLAMERRHFNNAVRTFNTSTMTFPSNLVATAFNFVQKPYFQAEDAAMKPITKPFTGKP